VRESVCKNTENISPLIGLQVTAGYSLKQCISSLKTYPLYVTHIGEGSSISVSYSESRLELENGNNITAETGTDYLRAQPESTSKEESWTYKIPAGAKPKQLNLFMDDTRVSVAVTLE
jgi:hypothetical protein